VLNGASSCSQTEEFDQFGSRILAMAAFPGWVVARASSSCQTFLMCSERQRDGKILIYGHDQMLRETRAQLLQNKGFSIDRPSTLGEFRRFVSMSTPYLLLILCQSLSVELREAGTELFSRIHRGVPIYDLRSSVEPTSFLAEVDRLLNERLSEAV
jgi:hypothetical protein